MLSDTLGLGGLYPLRGASLHAPCMTWCPATSWRSFPLGFMPSCCARLMATPGRACGSPFPNQCTMTRGNLCHHSCLFNLSGTYTHRTGKQFLSSVIQNKQVTECTVLDYNFYLCDGFFKLMSLNSYKIQWSRKNFDKSQHLSLGHPPPPAPQTSIAATSSVIFLGSCFFFPTYFYSNNLPGIPILQDIMGIKNSGVLFKWTKCFAHQFSFSKQRELGKFNKERVILCILISINAELASLWSSFLAGTRGGNSS